MQAARWFFRNWSWFNGGIAVVSGAVLLAAWADLSVIQRLMLGQFIVLNLHFVEEFALPGGFPFIANTVLRRSDTPRHYPLNQWTAWAGNNWFAFVVYLPAFLWSEVRWLTLAVTLFGFLEVLMHLVPVNVLLRGWFNPGLATSVVGFLPLGIAYAAHVSAAGVPIHGWEWVAALAWPIANYLLVFNGLLVVLLARRDTRFPFTERELVLGERWARHAHVRAA